MLKGVKMKDYDTKMKDYDTSEITDIQPTGKPRLSLGESGAPSCRPAKSAVSLGFPVCGSRGDGNPPWKC
jgi:hypothetical protein